MDIYEVKDSEMSARVSLRSRVSSFSHFPLPGPYNQAVGEPLLRTAAVITVSDGCFQGTRVDGSGPLLARLLTESGFTVVSTVVVPDEIPMVAEALRASAETASLVVTTGGTGLAPRDVTPEATMQVCTRTVPGLSELMRLEGMKQTPMASLSRGVCGTVGQTLILNLPGSPAGAVASLRTVLPLVPHALDLLVGKTEHAKPLES